MSLVYQRIRKQDLLLEAVLYDKLNKDELINYLIKIKGDDFNLIDSWTYAELEQAIKEFQREKTVVIQIEGQNQEVLLQTMSGPKSHDDFHYKEVIQCKQVTANQIVNYYRQNPLNDIQPKITEYEIIDEGFFDPKYVKYKILVEEFDCSVWRRVEQFYWLSEKLSLLYPDSLVPPLPSKTILRKYTPEHISKRCKMLSQFLSSLLSNHLLRQSELVEAFLIFDDDIKFKQIVVASEVIKAPLKINDYSNIDGNVTVEYNPLITQYFIDMNNYILHTNDVYKEMTNNSRYVIDSLGEFKSKLASLSSNVSSLRDLSKQFNQKTLIGSVPLLEFVYSLLTDYLNQWTDNLANLQKTLTENFYEFFRFQRDMQNKCCELISNRNKFYHKYQKENQELLKKKLKYFTSEPMEKWELVPNEIDRIKIQQNRDIAFPLMFPKDTMEVNELKVKYGYVNKQSYEQISQYFDHKSILYASRLKDMSFRKKTHTEEHYKQIELVAKQLDQIIQMRNGAHSGVDLPQQWVDEYYYPYSVTNILNFKIP